MCCHLYEAQYEPWLYANAADSAALLAQYLAEQMVAIAVQAGW